MILNTTLAKLALLGTAFTLVGIFPVPAGTRHVNRDGVAVQNNGGTATINPGGGNAQSATEAVVSGGSNAHVTGLDSNDIAVFESGADGWAFADEAGAVVEIYDHCRVTVRNYASTGTITISLADGTEVLVPPLSQVWVNSEDPDDVIVTPPDGL